MKVHVWRRRWLPHGGWAWHWWCPCCVGGEWWPDHPHALAAACQHVASVHR